VNKLRRLLLLLLLVPLAGLLFAGCGPGAEQVMKDSMRVSDKEIKTLHFDITQTIRLPRAPIQQGKVAKQNYVQQASGDFDLRTGDFQEKTQLVPGVEVAVLQVGKKQYWKLAGNWYDVPQSVQISPPVTQALSTSQYLKEFKNITKLGNTRVEGQSVYHIRAVPDMAELVKQPGVTDLLKDPNGKQIRTVDEIQEMKVVFDFYVLTRNDYFKRSVTAVESRAPNELIQLGYAEAGDKITQNADVTFSRYNEKLNLTAPTKTSPLPAKTP
jgi:hypothetical protein